MNKAHQKIILLVAAVSLLFLFRSLKPVIFDSDDQPDSQITVSTELNNISSVDIEGIKKEVQVALNSIPQILEIKYWDNTKIEIVDKGICYADGGIVFTYEGVGYLGWIGVYQQHHGIGAGEMLFFEFERLMKRRKIDVLQVKTLGKSVEYPPYDRSRNFYRKVGFRKHRSEITDNPECPEELILRKSI